MKLTIVLADDHKIVREGLRSLLEAEPDLAVVGETGDGVETIQLVERIRPDVLVLDLMMPGLSGLEVMHRVERCSPKTHVIILSMHADESYVLQALRNGASGYVVKDSGIDELVNAVREAVAGRTYLSRPLSAESLETHRQKARSTPLDRYDTLTRREREVLRLAAQGYASTEISAFLGISARTAEAHRANLMHKLNLYSQTDLIRFALQRKIITMEHP